MCFTTATTPATMLDVEVTSHETIRPSSPTPSHLRSMPLSAIDQLAPDIYIQVLLFFQGDGTATAAKAAILKESLSKTLTHFYPLTGRLSGGFLHADVHVDCNDEGARFYEATAQGRLDVILRRPPMRELYKLMPNGGANIKLGDPLVAVQLNAFACGGVALGVCVSHRVADAASLALFLNSWAEVARGGELICSPPRFHAASVLPPADLPQALVPPMVDAMLPERFVIRGPEVDKLRQEAAYGRAQLPTRVEAVATLLWRCVLRARPKANHSRRTPVALIPVNLRKKMPGELSDLSFGNLIIYAYVADDMAEEGAGRDRQAFLERSMRETIKRVDGDYVRGVFEGFLSGQNVMEDDSVDTMEFSSWCRVSFYKTDFGWGEPAWFCSVMRDLVNLIVLADTRDGRGVELWVWLPEEEMGRLQRDPELLEFVDPQSTSY